MFARWPRLFVCVLLPAGLLLASARGLGCFYETSHDLALLQLVRGVTAAAPVDNLGFSLLGLADVLAWLVRQWPAVPWFAVLLYGLLYVALVLAFAVVARLLGGRVAGWKLVALLVVGYATLWLEHGLSFSYVRVAVVLASGGLLYAAQRTRRRWAPWLGLVAFGIGGLVHPPAAAMGWLMVMPGVGWLAGRRAAKLLAGSGAWLGALLLLVFLGSESASTRLAAQRSLYQEGRLYQPAPATPADSLALTLAAVGMLQDSTLISAPRLRQAVHHEPAYFWLRVAPAKLQVLVYSLIRDYFPALLVLATLLAWVVAHAELRGRNGFYGALGLWAAVLLALGIGWQLPPRLALPLLNAVFLCMLIFVLREPHESERRAVRAVLLVLGILLLPYAVKTLRRSQTLLAEQHLHLQTLRTMHRRTFPARVVITDVLEPASAALDPWRRPRLSPGVLVVSLTGSETALAAQRQLLRHLTGTARLAQALPRLAARRATIKWYLTAPTAAVLNQLLQQPHSGGIRWQLVTRNPALFPAGSVPHRYTPAEMGMKKR